MPGRIVRWRALASHPRELADLAPEDQTQHESDSERGEHRLCRIFAHVLFRVFLKRADPAPGISPSLFCFTACFTPCLFRFPAVFFRERPRGLFQIFRRFASMVSATM